MLPPAPSWRLLPSGRGSWSCRHRCCQVRPAVYGTGSGHRPSARNRVGGRAVTMWNSGSGWCRPAGQDKATACILLEGDDRLTLIGRARRADPGGYRRQACRERATFTASSTPSKSAAAAVALLSDSGQVVRAGPVSLLADTLGRSGCGAVRQVVHGQVQHFAGVRISLKRASRASPEGSSRQPPGCRPWPSGRRGQPSPPVQPGEST